MNPQIELEKNVLATIISCDDMDALYENVFNLNTDYFLNVKHKEIVEAILRLVSAGTHPTATMVAQQVGANSFFLDVLEQSPSMPYQLPQIIAQMKTSYLKRVVRIDGNVLVDHASKPESDGETAMAAVRTFADKLENIWSERHDRTTAKKIKQAMEEIENGGKQRRIETGLAFYDYSVSHYRGQIHAIGAYPGGGKTAFALAMAAGQLLGMDMNVVYFCGESSSEEMIKRIIASYGNVPMKYMFESIEGTTTAELNAIADCATNLAKKADNFIVCGINDIRCDMAAVEAKIRETKRKLGRIDAVYIDYCQKFQPRPGKYRDKRERVEAVISDFHRMSAEFDFSGTMLSQLRREDEAKKPTMSSFAESSALEHNCHLMSVLFDPNQTKVGDDAPSTNKDIWWYSVKTRLVKPWSRRLVFRGDTGKFFQATAKY